MPLLTASRVVVVAGKGGVGKTTVTAVVARAAADAGRRVLVVELDGKPALADLVGDIDVSAIDAPSALDEYLREHGFARIAKRLASTGVIDVVGTAAPGIDDIVVLGKIKQLERSGDYDLIVVDGPAAGHAITFLTSARGLHDAARGGPVHRQARDVLSLLQDPQRCQVVLVTVPETTPVNEVVETAYALEERVGVQLGPVVVNGVEAEPDVASIRGRRSGDGIDSIVGVDDEVTGALRDAAAFRVARWRLQQTELARLADELALVQVRLPALPVAGLDAGGISTLAAAMAVEAAP
ncbi:MAG: ArsA-related P-loop ATPase [Ilumatobacteraceae bacterium]